MFSWYPPQKGIHQVTDTIKKMYDAPYTTFAKVSKQTKEEWYKDWKVIKVN